MSKIVDQFRNAAERRDYQIFKRKFEDGVVVYYGEIRHNDWSRTVHLWNLRNQTSVSGGIFVPILDLVVSALFPGQSRQSPVEYRIVRIDKDLKDSDDTESWVERALIRCDEELNVIKNPGDLARFLAIEELRQKSHSSDWSRSCSAWIALTYLGKGPDAALAALQEELKIARRLSYSKVANAAIDLFLFRRKPVSVFQRAKGIEEAIIRLDALQGSLPSFNPINFDFGEIGIERDKSASY